MSDDNGRQQFMVLYVEDNRENRILIRRILMAEGYIVIEAESAQTALTTAKIETPDLILMDINLPKMDGYALTSQLRTYPNLTQVPIIALTANVMKGDREKSLEAGCDGYIQKPINVDEFPAQVAYFLKR